MPCLWIAIRLKLRGANGSPSTASTRAITRGGRPDRLAQHQVAGLRIVKLGDRQLAPLFLVDRRQPEVSPSCRTTPSTSSAERWQLLHRMGDAALPALLGPGQDAVVDAESRALARAR